MINMFNVNPEYLNTLQNLGYVFLGVLIIKIIISLVADIDGAFDLESEVDVDGGEMDFALFSLNGLIASVGCFFYASYWYQNYLSGFLIGIVAYVLHGLLIQYPLLLLKRKTKGIETLPYELSVGLEVKIDRKTTSKTGKIAYAGKLYEAKLNLEDNRELKRNETVTIIAILDDGTIIIE